MSQALQSSGLVLAPPPDPAPPLPLSRRERSEQRRLSFLRRYRAGGEVKAAAAQAGIAHATLYRWRTQDDAFRARWDSVGDQRRFELEDLMMRVAREGVRTAVFHKGEEVGCRVDRLKPVVAMMDYLDRQESKRLETEKKRLLESHFSTAGSGEKPPFFGVSGIDDFGEDLDSHSDDDMFKTMDEEKEAALMEKEAAFMAAERAAEEAEDGAAAREAERQDEAEEEAEAREDREDRDSREAREVAREAAREAKAAEAKAEKARAKEAQDGGDATDAKSVPVSMDRLLLVRIVQTYQANGFLFHPGAIISIRGEHEYTGRHMERLTPAEVREHLAASAAMPPAFPGSQRLQSPPLPPTT